MNDTLRYIRRQIDYTQHDMATALGVSVGTIRNIEKAERVGSTPPLYLLAAQQVREITKKYK